MIQPEPYDDQHVCPNCGAEHDGEYGAFTREIAIKQFDGNRREKYEKWHRMTCEECHQTFALLDRTVSRVFDQETGEELPELRTVHG